MNTLLKSLLPLLLLTFNFCMVQEHTAKRVPDGDSEILVGSATLDSLHNQPFSEWYDPGIATASLDRAKVESLKPLLEGVEIVIFLGTWCIDSQRQVPKFVKILEESGYPTEEIHVVYMTRDKATPQKYEEGLDITNVPTFIFYRNGKEMNRIVEFPIEDLESDMLKILKGEPYKHAFAWD